MSRRMNVYLGLLILILVVAPNAFTQTSTAPTGDGSSGNPYQVDSLANLYWLTQTSSAWNSYFVQTADIDASSDSSWNAGAGFTPIGLSSFFSGTYDGNGHTISGLFISRGSGSDAGMFGSINGATLKNIKLTNVRVKVTGGGGYVGGLVAENYSSTLDSCSVSGSVSSSGNDVGGLVGRNVNNSGPSTISNSASSATVTGGSNAGVGGLVGDNNSSTINNCYSTGSVLDSLSGADLGGLVGMSENGSSVNNSYSTATVTGTGVSQQVGGLVGYLSTSSVVSCSVSGTVHGHDQSVGGLIGFATGTTTPVLA
ncbi:MAG TPA: GLUG motif-containing protein, partial [Terriglobia bacterium]|nr:GLUG motif-containing protein [Terriglobia bacterium]